jgi:hypothetical protein
MPKGLIARCAPPCSSDPGLLQLTVPGCPSGAGIVGCIVLASSAFACPVRGSVRMWPPPSRPMPDWVSLQWQASARVVSLGTVKDEIGGPLTVAAREEGLAAAREVLERHVIDLMGQCSKKKEL